jgi:hypothetical protein
LVTPSHEVDGLTGAEVMGDGWYIDLSLPADLNPFFGNGQPCVRLGDSGKVLLALGRGPIACAVPQGAAVYVIGGTDFCDNVETPPFFGADETAQRDCALALLDDVAAISLTIDGGNSIDLYTGRYEICSPQRDVQLLADNFLGVDPQTATFTACGWVAWLNDLPPGHHTIRTTSTDSSGSQIRTLVIDIVPEARPH